jgi:fructose-bisphosphate aldolase class II
VPLVTDPVEVEEIYDRLREREVCLPAFCTENFQTTEAIIRSMHQLGGEYGVSSPPAIIAFTGSYPYRPQAVNYTLTRNHLLGARAIMQDIKLFMSPDSPYRDLRLMIHIDHGQPDTDGALLEDLADIATVMFDCSMHPLEENIRRTAMFVEKNRKTVRVEGAVDEVSVTGTTQLTDLTTVEMADRFVRETGAYLIVPNLGTEQQSTENKAVYDAPRARAISRKVGKRIVLHGTSGVREADLKNLPADGVIRTNIWTALEKAGCQAEARYMIGEMGNILDEAQIRALNEQGLLGDRFFESEYVQEVCRGRLLPKVDKMIVSTRTVVWTDAVKERIRFYLDNLGYARLGRGT